MQDSQQKRHLITARILFAVGVICLAYALFLSISLQTRTSESLFANLDISLLSFVINYGYHMLFIAFLLAYIGLPISLNAILLAAGALAVDNRLSILVLIFLATLFAVSGDTFNYFIGKKLRLLKHHRHFVRFSLSDEHARIVDRFIHKWGKWGIFLTRWLFTPIGIPVNVIAGAKKYSFKIFVILSVIGELLWASLYVLLGYALGVNWLIRSSVITDTPVIITLLIVGTGCLLLASRIFHTNERA